MTENLIRIDLTKQECEMIVNGLRSISNSVKRAFPGVVRDPDFKMLIDITIEIEKRLKRDWKITGEN